MQTISVFPVSLTDHPEVAFELTTDALPHQVFQAAQDNLDDTIRLVAQTALNRPGEDFAVNEYFTIVLVTPPVTEPIA